MMAVLVPCSAEHMSAVPRLSVLASTSAPNRRRMGTTCVRPLRLAQWRAVEPAAVAALTSAPASSRRSTSAASPERAAPCRLSIVFFDELSRRAAANK